MDDPNNGPPFFDLLRDRVPQSLPYSEQTVGRGTVAKVGVLDEAQGCGRQPSLRAIGRTASRVPRVVGRQDGTLTGGVDCTEAARICQV